MKKILDWAILIGLVCVIIAIGAHHGWKSFMCGVASVVVSVGVFIGIVLFSCDSDEHPSAWRAFTVHPRNPITWLEDIHCTNNVPRTGYVIILLGVVVTIEIIPIILFALFGRGGYEED